MILNILIRQYGLWKYVLVRIAARADFEGHTRNKFRSGALTPLTIFFGRQSYPELTYLFNNYQTYKIQVFPSDSVVFYFQLEYKNKSRNSIQCCILIEILKVHILPQASLKSFPFLDTFSKEEEIYFPSTKSYDPPFQCKF